MTGRVAREESVLPWFSLTVGTDSKAVHSMGREVPVGPLRRGRAAASLLPWLETATGPNRLHLPGPSSSSGTGQDAAAGASHPAESSRGPSSVRGQATTLGRAQQDLWFLGVSEHCSGFP